MIDFNYRNASKNGHRTIRIFRCFSESLVTASKPSGTKAATVRRKYSCDRLCDRSLVRKLSVTDHGHKLVTASTPSAARLTEKRSLGNNRASDRFYEFPISGHQKLPLYIYRGFGDRWPILVTG